MSTPYDPNTGRPQDADPAAPTRFVPAGGGQVPPTAPFPQQGGFAPPAGPADAAPAGFGAPPAFGAPAPAQGQAPNAALPQYGQAPAPQYGQPPNAAPQFGQPPNAAPQYGQAPAPQFGQPPQGQQPGAPAWGQYGTQPMPNQPDPSSGAYPNQGGYPTPGAYPNADYGYGVPAQPAKAKRAGGVVALLFGTRLGRVVIGLVVIGGIAAYHFATADPAQRDSSGQVSQSGSLQATELQVGDCFDAPSGDTGITSIKAIPCGQAHDSQVFAEPAITETSFPGNAKVDSEANTDCGSDSAMSAISTDAPSTLAIVPYVPQDAETFDGGQRDIVCVINSDSADLTESYVSGSGAAS